jgi:hypothetical protein
MGGISHSDPLVITIVPVGTVAMVARVVEVVHTIGLEDHGVMGDLGIPELPTGRS